MFVMHSGPWPFNRTRQWYPAFSLQGPAYTGPRGSDRFYNLSVISVRLDLPSQQSWADPHNPWGRSTWVGIFGNALRRVPLSVAFGRSPCQQVRTFQVIGVKWVNLTDKVLCYKFFFFFPCVCSRWWCPGEQLIRIILWEKLLKPRIQLIRGGYELVLQRYSAIVTLPNIVHWNIHVIW